MAGSVPSSGAPDERYATPEGAVAYHEKHQGTWMRRLASRREQALLDRMLARIGTIESVLDCPCGAGRFLPISAPHARLLWACDLSPEMVRVTRSNFAGAGYAVGDAARIPLADDSVDVVVNMRLLHHISESADRTRILAEAARVARRGVVVSFADADTWRGSRSKSRRRPISRARFVEDAAAAGLALVGPIRPVAGLFSAFSFAALRADQK